MQNLNEFGKWSCNVHRGCQIEHSMIVMWIILDVVKPIFSDEKYVLPKILVNPITYSEKPWYLDDTYSLYDVLTITTDDDSAPVRYSISYNIYYWILNAITSAKKAWIERIPNSVQIENSKSEVWRRHEQ